MAATLNPKKTALLLLDLQNGILGRLPDDAGTTVVKNAATAISTAREVGAEVVYVHAALKAEEIAQIPDHNMAFAAIKADPNMHAVFHPEHAATQVHSEIAPQEGEKLYRKIRFGTFMIEPSRVMLDDFKEKGIDTVVVGGVITSGAVLSAVRQLADLDFHLVVLEDVCADYEKEVHDMLCEKVLSRQAKIIKSTELKNLFSA